MPQVPIHNKCLSTQLAAHSIHQIEIKTKGKKRRKLFNWGGKGGSISNCSAMLSLHDKEKNSQNYLIKKSIIIRDQPGLHAEFKVSQSYTVRPCLKERNRHIIKFYLYRVSHKSTSSIPPSLACYSFPPKLNLNCQKRLSNPTFKVNRIKQKVMTEEKLVSLTVHFLV